MAVGLGSGQRGPPEPSFDVIRKLWRVASLFFYGDRRAKARFLLVIVLVLCAVCAGFSPSLNWIYDVTRYSGEASTSQHFRLSKIDAYLHTPCVRK